MKKITTISLIASFSLIILLILGAIIVETGEWEIRVSWLTMTTLSVISALSIIFFLSITIKAFKSNPKWIKITLLSGYSIFTISLIGLLIIYFENQTIFFLCYSVVILALLLLIKGIKWKRIFLSIHSILLSVISIIILVISFVADEKDHVKRDRHVFYQSVNGNRKVVLQGEGVWEKQYIISQDLHIIRKRIDFDGNLPDGEWFVFNKSDEIVAQLDIKNGEIIKQEEKLPKNTIIVNSINDIKGNTLNDGFTYLIKGKLVLQEPIIVDGVKNIKFEPMPHELEAQVISKGFPCFKIINSINVNIRDISFNSKNANVVIEINNSENVNIQESILHGTVQSSISIDAESREIFINRNEFNHYKDEAIKAYSFNTYIENNKFNRNGKKGYSTAVNFTDIRFDSETGIELIENVLVNFDNKYINEDDEGLPVLFGKKFPRYEGTVDDLFYVYNIYNTLRNYLKANFYDNCECSPLYCSDFLEKITGLPLFVDYEDNVDPWCYLENGNTKFNLANPTFFKWIRNNLNLNSDYTIQGVSFDVIYNELFKSYFRNFYISYMYIQSLEELNNGISKYKSFVDSTKRYANVDLFVFHEFIDLEGNNINLSYYDESNGFSNKSEMDKYYQNSNLKLYASKVTFNDKEIDAKLFSKLSSFWIRRIIDGSATEIYLTLEHYLNQFDKKWMKSIKSYYK